MNTKYALAINTSASSRRRLLPAAICALLAIGISAPTFAGTLSFKASKIYPLGPAAVGIDVADINNDGKQDVIGADKVNGSLSILFGKGDGTFARRINYPETAFSLNNPDIRFLKIIAKDVSPLFPGVEVNVLTNGQISQLNLIQRPQDPPQGILVGFDGTTSGDLVDFAVEDFNHDGIFDEASASSQGFFEVDLRGKNHQFGLNSKHIYDGGQVSVKSMLTGDINLDSHIDIITLDRQAAQMNVSLGKRDGSYPTKTAYRAPIGIDDATIADLNKDGKPDVIMTSAQHNGGGISLFLGNGKGGFKTPKEFAAKSASQRPSHLAISDLNADGNMDVVVSFLDNTVGSRFSGSNELGVFLGNGDGTFQPNTNLIVGNLPDTSTEPGQIVIKDVNQDGKPDVLVATVSGVAVLLNTNTL